MKHLRTVLAPALVLSAVLATRAHAQTPLPISFEGRVGASIPTGDFSDGVKTGWNLGLTGFYSPQPTLALYLGFEHSAFSLDEDTEDVDVGIDDNAVRAGARLSIPLSAAPVRPFVEGGAVFARTSITGSDGEVSASVDSDWKVGFEVGAGFAFDVSPRVSLTPGVRYRQHGVSFDDVEGGDDLSDVSYVVVDLGVHVRL
jgi:hypothetical protein